MALDCVAEGTGVIIETIFENRFQHALELQRLGADIRLEGHTAIVTGRERPDRGAGDGDRPARLAALTAAALAADGATIIDRITILDRGYERIEAKFAQLGEHQTRILSGHSGVATMASAKTCTYRGTD